MTEVFDSEMPGIRNYESDRTNLDNLRKYADGEYNLFPNSHYRKREPEKERQTSFQIESNEDRPTGKDIVFADYGLNLKLGDWVYIGQDEVQLISANENEVTLYNGTLFPTEMSPEMFARRVKENPMNEGYVLKEPDEPPTLVVPGEPKETQDDNTRTKITVDTSNETVHWIYFNPDSDEGGQYVSGKLGFSVFEEAVKDYDLINHPENTERFVNDIEEMSDQFLADIHTPFYTEAEDDYSADCDYTDFTYDNLLKIHRDIDSYYTDLEAQKAGDAYEAEFGADGYRMFPGNAPDAETEETAMPTILLPLVSRPLTISHTACS